MSTTPAVSEQALADLRTLNPDDPRFLNEVIQLFLDDMPRRFSEMEKAIGESDATLLIRSAHSIKGSGSNFGAAGLIAAAAMVEQQGHDGAFAQARNTLPSLQAEYADVEAALRKYL